MFMSVGCATVFITRRKKNQMNKNPYQSVVNSMNAMIVISIVGIIALVALLIMSVA